MRPSTSSAPPSRFLRRESVPVGCPPEMAMLMKACWHNDITCRPQAHEIDRTLKALDASKMGVVSIRKKTDANVVLQDIFFTSLYPC